METLYQLIYTSFIAPDTDQRQVHQIAARSRAKNERIGVTGLLIFDGLRICQYLEGPSQTLFPLIDQIRIDPRHIEFDIKEHKHTTGMRRFPKTAMGFAMSNSPEGLDLFHKFNPHAEIAAFSLLDHFVSSLDIES